MEKRKRVKFSNISVSQHDIDSRFESDTKKFVMEHTLIESYLEQISDNHQFDNLFEPLKNELSGTLPAPGHYILCVKTGAVKGIKNESWVRKNLSQWLREKAPVLKLRSPSQPSNFYIREMPQGVPFEVALYRFPGKDGEFFISFFSPENLEEERRVRIRKALDDKCPKLLAARGNDKTSVLVLEYNDISLGNYVDIGNVLVQELSLRQNDIPDEIYLVWTGEKQTAVIVLKEGLHIWPNVSDDGPHNLDPA